MRSQAEIARRLLDARATVRELERKGAGRSSGSNAAALDSARLVVYRALAQALAWALDIDLNLTDIPSLALLAPEEQPTTVQLHRLELGEAPHTLIMWLAEIPAHDDAAGPDYSTESWSCFLHDEQAQQLRDALVAALAGERTETAGLRLPPLQPRSLQLSHSQPRLPRAPAAPDTVGGYANYARLAEPSRDDQDDDDPPTLSPAAPRGA